MTEQARLAPAPLAVAGAALVGAVTLATVDPNRTRLSPPCPFHGLTGWWCPLCGATRAVHALVQGDIDRALSFNAFVITAAPVLLVLWAMWCIPSLRPAPRRQLYLTQTIAGMGIVSALAFLIARNTAFPALAP
ncbi:MAG: DUF2752 domain-containing protein [Acidimicrobiia bacterium]